MKPQGQLKNKGKAKDNDEFEIYLHTHSWDLTFCKDLRVNTDGSPDVTADGKWCDMNTKTKPNIENKRNRNIFIYKQDRNEAKIPKAFP